MEILVSEMNLDEESENENEPIDSKSHVDTAFIKFQKRLARDPHQILRYAPICIDTSQNPNHDDLPLWANAKTRPPKEHIGHCIVCKSEKQFELQILPQVIYHLKSDMDWGSLFIYTCPNLCKNEESYTEECIWKQEFTKDGMRNPNDLQTPEKE